MFLVCANYAQTSKDIDIYKGDSHTISFEAPYDVSSDSLLFVVKADRDDSTPRVIALRNTAGGGSDSEIEVIYSAVSTILVKLTQINTEGLTAALYVYDLTIDSTTTLYTGTLKLRDEVGGSADGVATRTPYYTIAIDTPNATYSLPVGDDSDNTWTPWATEDVDSLSGVESGSVNVKDYFVGLVDGKIPINSDITAALKLAIATGLTVIIPGRGSAVYFISDTIVIPTEGQIVRGSGQSVTLGLTRLRAADSFTGGILFQLTAHGTSVRDIMFDGNNRAKYAIDIVSASDIYLENVNGRSFVTAASDTAYVFHATSCFGATLVNCRADLSEGGISVTNSNNINSYGSRYLRNGINVYVSDAEDVNFHGGSVEGNSTAVDLNGGVSRNFIFTGAKAKILLSGVYREAPDTGTGIIDILCLVDAEKPFVLTIIGGQYLTTPSAPVDDIPTIQLDSSTAFMTVNIIGGLLQQPGTSTFPVQYSSSVHTIGRVNLIGVRFNQIDQPLTVFNFHSDIDLEGESTLSDYFDDRPYIVNETVNIKRHIDVSRKYTPFNNQIDSLRIMTVSVTAENLTTWTGSDADTATVTITFQHSTDVAPTVHAMAEFDLWYTWGGNPQSVAASINNWYRVQIGQSEDGSGANEIYFNVDTLLLKAAVGGYNPPTFEVSTSTATSMSFIVIDNSTSSNWNLWIDGTLKNALRKDAITITQ